MGVPVIFLLIAPLAGLLSLQLTPPFSSAAVILSLVFSACGLVQLYRYLLLPLRKLSAVVSQKADEAPLVITTACDVVRVLEDSLNTRESALRRDLNEARDTVEKLQREVQGLRESRAETTQVQLSVLDALRKAQTDLTSLAAPLAAALGSSTAGDQCDPRRILNIAADLNRSECALVQTGQLGGEKTAPASVPPPQDEVFPWKSRYATGIAAIDAQHKLLVSYINKLHNGMQKGCDKALLLEILDDLTGYAFTHFATEEIYFTRSAYPLTAEHIEAHRQFRETVTQLQEAVLDGKAFIDIALLEYLKKWLVAHIQEMDVAFAPYVTGQPSSDSSGTDS